MNGLCKAVRVHGSGSFITPKLPIGYVRQKEIKAPSPRGHLIWPPHIFPFQVCKG